MGDTGSLALGGFVAGAAYMMQMPLFILIVGLIYLVEVASVIIQVTYFKKTGGKRIFKMAPIHHHFELCGWSETRVVAVFSIITAILMSDCTYGGIKMDIRDKNVLVFGSGISGIAASRLLLREGADVILYDGNEKLDAETIKENILHDEEHGVTLTGDVKVILGELSKEVMESLVLIVMSPGVPTDLASCEPDAGNGYSNLGRD